MPWKPPSVNDKYGRRWDKISSQRRKKEPLCRLCLSAGVIMPAEIVDHIVPLEDGGSNEESNLMPLCKRCHDSVKTPADRRQRRRAEMSHIKLVAASIGSEDREAGTDLRVVRRAWLKTTDFNAAHQYMLAAAEGILQAASRGHLKSVDTELIVDDWGWCVKMKEAFGCEAEKCVMQSDAIISDKLDKSERMWLRIIYNNEYSYRHEQKTKGSQPERSTDRTD